MLAFVTLMVRYRSNDLVRPPILNRTSTQRAITWLNLISSTKSVKKSWKRKEKKKKSSSARLTRAAVLTMVQSRPKSMRMSLQRMAPLLPANKTCDLAAHALVRLRLVRCARWTGVACCLLMQEYAHQYLAMI